MTPYISAVTFKLEMFGDESWINVGDEQWARSVLKPAFADDSEAGVYVTSAEMVAIMNAEPPKVNLDSMKPIRSLARNFFFLLLGR